ncbi:unnamed protein product, partial [Closterium sp. Naga37s-1]
GAAGRERGEKGGGGGAGAADPLPPHYCTRSRGEVGEGAVQELLGRQQGTRAGGTPSCHPLTHHVATGHRGRN